MRYLWVGHDPAPKHLLTAISAVGHQCDSVDAPPRALERLCETSYEVVIFEPNLVSGTDLAWLHHLRTIAGSTTLIGVANGQDQEHDVLVMGLDGLLPADEPDPLAYVDTKREERNLLMGGEAPSEPHVLLVDDDVAVRSSIGRLLRRRGYQVEAADDPWEALALLRSRRFQILLSDQAMPGLQGNELVAATRRYDPRVVPVILTGAPSLEIAVKALRGGSTDFLSKPIEPPALFEAIDRAWVRWQVDVRADSVVTDARADMRILLVEDQDSDAALVRQRLSAQSRNEWSIDWVRTVTQAIERLESESFEAVLLDLGLPDSSGRETFLRLQAHAKDCPVVVLTADDDPQRARELMILGAQEYLTKDDVEGDRLANRVRFAIERQRVLRRLDELVVNMDASDASRLQAVDPGKRALMVLDRTGTVLQANRQAEFLFDRYGDELVGHPFGYPVAAESSQDIDVVRRSGEVRVIEIRTIGTTWEGTPALLASLEDVTRVRQSERALLGLTERLSEANRRLKRLATVDPLTSVLNRRGFDQHLQKELEAAQRSGSNLAVCLVDCDDFKRVNDRYGHGTGDVVLRRVARLTVESLRQTDLVSRIGGDEFLVLMPRTTLAEAHMVGERMRATVAADPILVDEHPVNITVSVGVVTLPWDISSIEEILMLTRSALKNSKQRKNMVSGAHPMIRDVEGLLDGGNLAVMAQPIVRLADSQVVGYELLTRGPEGALYSPIQFLRAARDTSLLTPIDLECLRSCLRETPRFPAGMLLHVNIFPTTLLEVSSASLAALFEPYRDLDLYLELSEEQFVGDPDELTERLACLREMGVGLAIDDIGRGRGTLDNAMLLEPDILKIDRKLVHGIANDGRKQRLLRRLTVIARGLETRVLAEGVERPADAEALVEFGVELGQGYLWSKPVAMDELLAGWSAQESDADE